MPGGGTTDYAVDIYHSAVKGEDYNCFLNSDTVLPMVFMEDAVRATIELMEAPIENISIRTAYNLGAMSFSPSQIAAEIKKKYSNFRVKFVPDFRQEIAEKWPKTIDDTPAQIDWNWTPKYDLEAMTIVMLEKLEEQYNKLK